MCVARVARGSLDRFHKPVFAGARCFDAPSGAGSPLEAARRAAAEAAAKAAADPAATQSAAQTGAGFRGHRSPQYVGSGSGTQI